MGPWVHDIDPIIGTIFGALDPVFLSSANFVNLLLQMARAAQTAVRSPLAFARLVSANLMHRKRIDCLSQRHETPPDDPGQMAIQWT